MTIDKIDSNATGCRFAEEASIKTLPGSPVWWPLEPNSYKDFGGSSKLVSRNPINPSRQRQKGVITDLDAKGGLNQDLTMNNFDRLMQGFFFANWREHPTTRPMNLAGQACTSVSVSGSNKYNFGASPGAFLAGMLALATGFGVTANNGLKLVTAVDATDLVTTSTVAVEASPPAAAKLRAVGFQGASGDLTLATISAQIALESTALDFTTLGLLEGGWVWVGGDTTASTFATGQGGLARIALAGIAAHVLTFDKVSWTSLANDTGTGKTIQVFMADILRNEPLPADILFKSYQIERTLGLDADGTMSEYLVGSLCSDLSINMTQADKINVDIGVISCDNEQRTGAIGIKGGTRPNDTPESAINTSSDLKRVNLALVSANASVLPLFAFATDVGLTINNNVTPNKALAVLGAFNMSAGEFDVDGKLTVYFADITAVQAVRNNSDVTLDLFTAKDNQGQVFDLPLIALGNGLLGVEANKPITLPLDTSASVSPFGYTMSYSKFGYLPNVAMA